MQFILVKNQQQILLGPRDWHVSLFLSVLEEEEITLAEPLPLILEGYLKITDGVEIFPIGETLHELINPKIEQPAGPFFTYDNEAKIVHVNYTAAPKDIDQIKNELKTVIAATRFQLENAGVKLTLQGTEVKVASDRTSRAILASDMQVDKLWKFNQNTWLTLTAEDLSAIGAALSTLIQNAFTWEHDKQLEIDACTDVVALNAVNISVANSASDILTMFP